MATTTTIYPTDDTHIREPNPTTNYGTGIYLPLGEWSGGRRHALIEFDVSSFTNPSDIVEANFSLTAISSSVTSPRHMTLARLDQSFGDTTATWNTYDGSNAWTTAGAFDDAATTEPTYSIQIGATANQTVDIKDLVIDAINKRAGALLLIIYFTSGAVSYTTFGSTDNASTPNKPSIAVTVAERTVWTGGVNTDLDNNLNWSTGTAPTASDFAIFNNSVDANSGSLTCNRILIGAQYTGDLGTSSTRISIAAESMVISSPHAGIWVDLNAAASSNTTVRVIDASVNVSIDGKYDIIINRARGALDLISDDLGTLEAHSRSARFVADSPVTTVRMTNSKGTLQDGATTATIVGANLTLEGSTKNDTDIIMAGARASLRCLANTIDDITIWGGSVSFMTNTGSPIVTGDIVIYSGLLDTRTGAPTFTTNGITVHGGRVRFDGSMETVIS